MAATRLTPMSSAGFGRPGCPAGGEGPRVLAGTDGRQLAL